MDQIVIDKLIEAQLEKFPILECSECGEMAYILQGEGIGLGYPEKHYPVGECANCGCPTPKEA